MNNLFSSFDPTVIIIGINLSLNWLAALGPLLFLPQIYWLRGSQITTRVKAVINYMSSELRALFGPRALPGTLIIFISMFYFVLVTNFIGLFPYVFTRSRHLRITLSLGLPLWLGMIVWSILFQLINFMSHLVPVGTPGPLIPFMVLIETVRNIIRPGTLSIRLAANIVAGHLLLTLLGSQGDLSLFLLCLMVALFLLLLLEVGVACIQAYVFTVLRSLYLSETISKQFNISQSYVKFIMSSISYCWWVSLAHFWVNWGTISYVWDSENIPS